MHGRITMVTIHQVEMNHKIRIFYPRLDTFIALQLILKGVHIGETHRVPASLSSATQQTIVFSHSTMASVFKQVNRAAH